MQKEIFSVKKKKIKMFKEIMICFLVFIFVFGVNVFTKKCTEDSINIINEKLEKVKNSILDSNEEYRKNIDETFDIWDEKKKCLEFFIEHEELEKIELELRELKAKDTSKSLEDGLINVEKAKFLLNHIKEKYRLKIQNIF